MTLSQLREIVKRELVIAYTITPSKKLHVSFLNDFIEVPSKFYDEALKILSPIFTPILSIITVDGEKNYSYISPKYVGYAYEEDGKYSITRISANSGLYFRVMITQESYEKLLENNYYSSLPYFSDQIFKSSNI